PLINALMTDERTQVIVATGGGAGVPAPYSSRTPAVGGGPGDGPALVGAPARLPQTAPRGAGSKSFDDANPCRNEAALLVLGGARPARLRRPRREGACLLEPEQAGRVAAALFPGGQFDIRFVGKGASWIAGEAGIRVPGNTRVLLAPFGLVVPEEPLAHEKLCP